MGRSGAGKTSMRSIIFSNHVAKDTRRLGATIDVESNQIRFLGEMRLDLWDCGGQESFLDNFLTTQRDSIFSHVHSLIYIFDVESPYFSTTDMHYFVDCLAALKAKSGPRPTIDANSISITSPDGTHESPETGALVHVLIHKLDLVSPAQRSITFQRRKEEILRKCREAGWDGVATFGTSIWDETLYGAWSQIVSTLIPNVASLRQHLAAFAEKCKATEVVLFERQTFLVISRSTSEPEASQQGWELGRFDKICQCIKIFRLSCSRSLRVQFSTLEMCNAEFTAVLDVITPNTYIMVISTEPGVQPAGIRLNLRLSRSHFANLQALTWGRAF